MQAIHIAGYIASILIGISLGLIGGGGSILTVPVLVYFFGISPVLATSYSLVIVGVTSIAGTVKYGLKGLVNTKVGLIFGASSIITVLFTRKWLIPLIPHTIVTINGWELTHGLATLLFFALLMIFAAFSMISNATSNEAAVEIKHPNRILFLYGIAIGLVTGFLGAGGGFLIIPALVVFCKLPMKTAIGTSLLIISLNAIIGFLSDLTHYQFEWTFLITLTIISLVGFFIGSYWGKQLPAEHLKKGFGWFVLLMGIFILMKELIFS